ncbi:hypothetical protein [Clostridium kluyveri]|uniref:Uncharacterized protein n=2 Tax=Clostridium kluyveri TaxID=1534 RepID=A5N7A3_CLOK5|nr:hypothetical protein [Clostridium kluyveri]EDK33184.1 Conserved hypothetical protein [Clostridium kluyveri DSM 555]BAH06091.1 hypothetical protein CKR_1040 [Clostridium kluyveri NBRC 12016]
MLQSINSDHIKGALVGVGVCAVGYYVYRRNQRQVDSFLKEKGIDVCRNTSKDYRTMSLEELMETKELIEDIIAERGSNDEVEDAKDSSSAVETEQ